MKVLLLGGSGFIGGHLQKQRPDWTWHAPSRQQADLLSSQQLDKIVDRYDLVINAAGFYGGLPFNQLYADQILLTNTTIFHNVIELVRKIKPQKFIQIGSACLYPGNSSGALKEEFIGQGNIHSSIFASGLAKYYQLRYLENTDLPWEYLILTNVYGPGEPLDPQHSHFVGSLINRLVCQENPFKMIGTGASIRDFLYVKDAVEAICRTGELEQASCMPINISTGIGISIKEITEKLLSLTKNNVQIVWGDEKDNGIMQKVLDNSRMQKILNFKPATSLDQGLLTTWNYYNKDQ